MKSTKTVKLPSIEAANGFLTAFNWVDEYSGRYHLIKAVRYSDGNIELSFEDTQDDLNENIAPCELQDWISIEEEI